MKVRQLRSLAGPSDEKRSPKFVGEIQAMIDNDPNKSIRSIAKKQGSVWVSYLASSERKHSVFFIQVGKEPIFITGYERQEQTPVSKFFNKL